MFFKTLRRWLNGNSKTSQLDRRQGQRPAKSTLRPWLECLEDRTVPAILFHPGVSATISDHNPGQPPGPVLTSPQVELVFWGSNWNTGSNPALRINLTIAVTDLIQSSYIGRLSQYGVGNGVLVGPPITITSTSPGTNFTNANVQTMLSSNIGGSIPYHSNWLYMVIAQPGSTDPTEGLGGEHAVGSAPGSGNFYYGWTTNTGTNPLDSITTRFSHEYVEAATDPSGTTWQLDPRNQVSWNEICDGEAQNYTFRVDNYLVQSYYSAVDNAYVVPNGSVKNFLVSTTGVLTLQDPPYTSSTLEVSRVGNGVFAKIDQSTAQFDPAKITGITVIGAQGDFIFIDQTGADAPVTVNGSGDFTVHVGQSGSVRGIKGLVNINPSSGTVALNVDASSDPGGNFTLTVATITYLAPAPIYFSRLRALSINASSHGSNIITVQMTPTAPVTLNTGLNSDFVNVHATFGPLTVNGQSGLDKIDVGLNGSTQTIHGPLTVTNAGGYSGVTVDDSNDTVARTVIVYKNLAATVISGLTPGGDISLVSSQLRFLIIRAGAGGNTFRIHDTPFSSYAPGGAVTDVITGTGNDLVTVDGTTGPLGLNGSGGLDTVNIGTGDLSTIHNSVTVANTGGFSAVNVNDSADQSARTVLLYNNGATNGISTVIDGFPTGGDIVLRGADLRSLAIHAGSGGNTFRIHDTPTSATPGGLTTSVDTGIGGDMVTVDGTTGALDLNTQGGNDNVFVGSTNGGLGRIQGAVVLPGAGGHDTLTFNDQLTTTPENFTLTVDQLTRVAADGLTDDMAPISFTSFETIALNVGSGGSAAAVTGSSAGSTVTVNSNPGGQNEFAVDASTNAILGPVIFNGQIGSDYAQYYDIGNAAPHTYTLTSTSVSRDGLATVFSNVGMIVYAPIVGGNTVNVNSVALGGAYKIQAASGDHVTVGSLAPGLGGTLADILEQVNVTSYTSDDVVSVVLDDSGNTDTTAKQITFSGFDADGNLSLLGLTPIALSWNLPLASSVTVLGGAANETFSMNPLVAVTPLTIIGGAGVNTVDYSAYTTGVNVDLATGAATDLAAIANIRNVIGGSGDDILTANALANVLMGGAGNDLLTGGAGRDILVGGSGSDFLYEGNGGSILIGGVLSYYNEAAQTADTVALNALQAEWSRTDLDYEGRVNHLNGSVAGGLNGTNLIDNATVLDDGQVDTIFDGSGQDWLWPS
jgi:RTX calcium-binding nonapeptide repeat (4 copies)